MVKLFGGVLHGRTWLWCIPPDKTSSAKWKIK